MCCSDSAVAAGASSVVASVRSSCLLELEALGACQLCLPGMVCLAGDPPETLCQAAEASCLPVEEQQSLHQQPVPQELHLRPAAFATFGYVESAEECVALVRGLDEGLHSKPEKRISKTDKNYYSCGLPGHF